MQSPTALEWASKAGPRGRTLLPRRWGLKRLLRYGSYTWDDWGSFWRCRGVVCKPNSLPAKMPKIIASIIIVIKRFCSELTRGARVTSKYALTESDLKDLLCQKWRSNPKSETISKSQYHMAKTLQPLMQYLRDTNRFWIWNFGDSSLQSQEIQIEKYSLLHQDLIFLIDLELRGGDR